MNIQSQLKIAGLNHSEITVYLFLLENGISTPPLVSRGTKIARTNCYNILEDLKNKDLITEQAVGKRKAYVANDPESLIRTLDKKREAIQTILPDLRGIFTTQKNKPKIRFYEGVEQIKNIYLDTLSAEKVLGLGSTEYLAKLMPEFYKSWVEQVKENGTIFYDVLSAASKHESAPIMQNVLKGLYDVAYLPEKYKNFPTDIMIWNDNIALITLEEPIFGTIITNKLIARTFGILFEIIRESIVR